MARRQIGLATGEVIAFDDERDIDTLITDIQREGYLRINGERTVLGSQALRMEGEYVVFAHHILSLFE